MIMEKPSVYEQPTIYNGGAGGGGGQSGGIYDIPDYMQNIDGVIAQAASAYNFATLPNLDTDEITFRIGFYFPQDVTGTGGSQYQTIALMTGYNCTGLQFVGHNGMNNLRITCISGQNSTNVKSGLSILPAGLYECEIKKDVCKLKCPGDADFTSYNVAYTQRNNVQYLKIPQNLSAGGYSLPAYKYVEVIVSGVTKYYLVPVKRDVDDKGTLFDLVNGTFDWSHTYDKYTA